MRNQGIPSLALRAPKMKDLSMRRFVLALIVFALATAAGRAEEEIFIRGQAKSTKGDIKEESGRGITVGKLTVPAADIVDVVYQELEPVTVRFDYRNKGVKAEKDGKLADAMAAYEDALKKMKAGQKSAERHLQFKIAVLSAQLARDEGGNIQPAIARLKNFNTKYTDCWQLTTTHKLLARIFLDQKQFKDAEDTYKALAAANVADDVKQEADLSAALVSLAAGKHEVASKNLESLIARLPQNSPYIARARIGQAECLAVKKPNEARKQLQQIIKETTDRSLKAAAYNAMGEIFFKEKKLKEARWEFLWVDVEYNQDRAEHGKALYYLMEIFFQLSEIDRARECREALLDTQFNGLEYQRLAKDKKLPAE
jgi:tetratricopeptide (TPR) repeat protein